VRGEGENETWQITQKRIPWEIKTSLDDTTVYEGENETEKEREREREGERRRGEKKKKNKKKRREREKEEEEWKEEARRK
jgi:hypothetical protein